MFECLSKYIGARLNGTKASRNSNQPHIEEKKLRSFDESALTALAPWFESVPKQSIFEDLVIRLDGPGRHTGIKVTESIVEI